MDKVFYILLGLMILLVNGWYIHSVYNAFFSRQLIIAPFRVIGRSDDGTKYGETLASLLDARLAQIQRDLKNSQSMLRRKQAANESKAEVPLNPAADPRTSYVSTLPLPLVDMNTNLFQPADINVKVSGVELRGLFAWLQRRMTNRRTINFSVYVKENKATISGNLGALSGSKRDSIWLEATSDPLGITDKIAYAIIQRKMVEAQTESIAAFEVDEVQTLLTTLFQVADLNRKADAGRPIAGDIAALFPAIDQLAQKVPDWPSLVFFAASMAESAGQVESAIDYYRKLRTLARTADGKPIPIDIATIERKIADLMPSVKIAAERGEQTFEDAAAAYAKRMKLPGSDPGTVFKKLDGELQTYWDAETHRYQVNTDHIKTVGLPEYVALMGRFMLKHYDKCFGEGATQPATQTWNDFRYSLTDYLIRTDPVIAGSLDTATLYPESYWQLARILNKLDTDPQTDQESVRKLALALPDRYQCDWDFQSNLSHALEINQELHLVSDQSIRDAFASEGHH